MSERTLAVRKVIIKSFQRYVCHVVSFVFLKNIDFVKFEVLLFLVKSSEIVTLSSDTET